MDSWYKRNKEYARQKQKEYKSTTEFKEKRKEQDRKNKDHINELKRKWRHGVGKQKEKISKQKSDKKYRDKVKDTPEFKEKESIRGKKYRSENKEKISEYNKKYSKLPKVVQRRRELERIRYENNPEKKFDINIRYLNKLSQPVNMDRFEYQVALMSWTKTIRKRFDNLCQICFNKADHSHHIFHKAKYPKLALNLNNGIPLCKSHHHEVHWGYV